jgi:hypothetical protein
VVSLGCVWGCLTVGYVWGMFGVGLVFEGHRLGIMTEMCGEFGVRLELFDRGVVILRTLARCSAVDTPDVLPRRALHD